MIHNDFEKELNDESQRLDISKQQLEDEITLLIAKIEKYTKWAWFSVCIGLIIGLIPFFVYFKLDTTSDFAGLNLLGDFLAGSVGSIWSLSGLFFVYIAFLGQKVQILHQRIDIMAGQQELKYARLQIMGQKKEMEIQNETLLKQNFENTFFELLKHLKITIDNLKLVHESGTKSGIGIQAFRFFYEELKLQTNVLMHKLTKQGYQSAPIAQTVASFNEVFSLYKTSLNPYYKTVFLIIKFIDESSIIEKKFYISIIRSQLSDFEKIFLFYRGLTIDWDVDENVTLHDFIGKYGIFSDLQEDLLFNRSHLKAYESATPQ